MALLHSCRNDNPAFHLTNQGAKNVENSSEEPESSRSESNSKESFDSDTAPPPRPDHSSKDPQDHEDSTASALDAPSSSEELSSSTSEDATRSSETSTSPPPAYCGTGPDLCYLVEQEPTTDRLPNERGSDFALQITANTLATSNDRPSNPDLRAATLQEEGTAALSIDAWQPSENGFGFDLYAKLQAAGKLPRVVFGLKGRLLLERNQSGHIVCSYNNGLDVLDYDSTPGWSNPRTDSWVHLMCVYDGDKVSLWVDEISPFQAITVNKRFDGPKIPIQIGGDMSAPAGAASGSRAHFRGSLSGIRIWSNLNALEAATSYSPK